MKNNLEADLLQGQQSILNKFVEFVKKHKKPVSITVLVLSVALVLLSDLIVENLKQTKLDSAVGVCSLEFENSTSAKPDSNGKGLLLIVEADETYSLAFDLECILDGLETPWQIKSQIMQKHQNGTSYVGNFDGILVSWRYQGVGVVKDKHPNPFLPMVYKPGALQVSVNVKGLF